MLSNSRHTQVYFSIVEVLSLFCAIIWKVKIEFPTSHIVHPRTNKLTCSFSIDIDPHPWPVLLIIHEKTFELAILVFLYPLSLSFIIFPPALVCYSASDVDHLSLPLTIVCDKATSVLIPIRPGVFPLTLLFVIIETTFITIAVHKDHSGKVTMFKAVFELAFIPVASLILNSLSVFLIIFPIAFVSILIISVMFAIALSSGLDPITIIVFSSL